MMNPITEKDLKVQDKKEIDFLKQTKKHTEKSILLISAFVFLIAFLGVMAKYFIIGNDVNAEYLNYTLCRASNNNILTNTRFLTL